MATTVDCPNAGTNAFRETQHLMARDSWSATVVAELSEVVSNIKVNAEYRHLVARCSEKAAAAQPGQFFQLLCPRLADEQPFLRRPMSLYGADPPKHQVEFLYRVTGAGTRGLERLRTGDRLDIMGPLGVGFTLDAGWRHIVVVGRGVGLATLAPLAGKASAGDIRVTAVLSARRAELLVSADLFRAHGAQVINVTDSDQTSDLPNVERILRRVIADGRCEAFFTCGSARLMRLQQRLAQEFGLPGQVAMEQQMACGIGLCHACVRQFAIGDEIISRRVCWDGPVFDLKEALS